jgi:hypothetical protein
MADDTDWIVMGDFNFIKNPKDRNKPGGDVNDMLLFNEAISNLGLVELPLKERQFTWSNMQKDPLLERLDWFFTSASWTLSYPSTMVYPLSKPTSNHVLCVVAIGTKIPRARIFRFENFWLNHSSFKGILENAWNIPVNYSDSAKRINAKFKNQRRGLKLRAQKIPCIKDLIAKVNETIDMLDTFEEWRSLTVEEWNLRDILKSHVLMLLHNQNVYWKQRGKIKWVKLGNENTKFFHTKATINYRNNYIPMLINEEQVEISDDEGKAALLWKAFKERMGQSDQTSMKFNLREIYGESLDAESLASLESPFSEKEIQDVIEDLPMINLLVQMALIMSSSSIVGPSLQKM